MPETSGMPRVSVVIPAYNAERHIRISVASALDQTCSDLEVVVVDDGSSDATIEQLGIFNDSRLRVLRQANQGQSAAINHGVAGSRGAYIKLLDADDWLNPRHIDGQLQAIGGSSTLLGSCTWGYFTDDFTRPRVRPESSNRDYDKPLEWLVDCLTRDEGMMGGWMWLIPRTLWTLTGGFDPRLSLNNDFDFSIRLVLASDGIRFAPDAVYSYRASEPGNLSATSSRVAMESAWLTTDLGTRHLLQREDSPRIRRICANRFQQWLFEFYPHHADLAARAERRIDELGGSGLELQGGLLFRALKPLLGWKGVRRLQHFAYRHGWQRVLERKRKQRLSQLN